MSLDALSLAEPEISGRRAVQQSNLPSGWAWTSLRDVTAPVSNIDPRKDGPEFIYIDLAATQAGSVTKAQRLNGRQAPSRARQLVQTGDVLFSGVRIYLRNIALVDASYDGSIASTAFCVLRPDAALDPKYLFYFVTWQKFINSLLPLQRGNSPPAVLDADIKAQPLPLPPLAEQRRIVARIDELFAEIAEGEAALKRARRGLDTWRRALLKAAVTGELTRDWRKANPPTETAADLLTRIRAQARGPRRGPAVLEDRELKPLPELPPGWAWVPLGGVIEGLRNGTSTVPVKRQTEFPILRISAVRPMAVDASDFRYLDEQSAQRLDEFRTRRGDLLFTRYNGSRHLVGVCGVFHGERPMHYPDKIIRARLVPQLQDIDSFFEAAINSGNTRKFINGEIKTTAGQHGIAGASLARAPIPVPPITEAKKIIELLRDNLARAEDLDSLQVVDSKSAAAFRQAVLRAAFEGRLVAQDPADEPAAVLLARLASDAVPHPALRRRKRRGSDDARQLTLGAAGTETTLAD